MFSRSLPGLLACGLLVAAHWPARADVQQAVEPMLAEKWSAAATALLRDTSQQSNPVARLLIGYTDVASNHTNEALAMFVSVRDLNGLRSWKEWTEGLARDNPGNRVAALLLIDARARLGEVGEASEFMQSLLKNEPRFALAYDLAGALAMMRNDLTGARTAFATATTLDPKLADGWISRGTLEAIARTPLDFPNLGNIRSVDVLGYFDRAVKLDPNSAPALLGRGVILYGLGRYSEAADLFDDAERVDPRFTLSSYDSTQTKLTVLRRYAVQTSAAGVSNPGSTIETSLQQESQVLADRAQESAAHLAATSAAAKNVAAPIDPKIFDTADQADVKALVAKYGLTAVQQAVAARLDANLAAVNQGNQKIQQDVKDARSLRDLWLGAAIIDTGLKLWPAQTVGGNAVRLLGTAVGEALDRAKAPDAASHFTDLAAGQAESFVDAKVKGENPWKPPSLKDQITDAGKGQIGVVSDLLNDVFRDKTYEVTTRSAQLNGLIGITHHDMLVSQWVRSPAFQNLDSRQSSFSSSSLKTVLAPSNYSLDPSSQAALVRAVSEFVRGSGVVLVPQDRMQGMLLQQELNRQGVATRVAQTAADGISLAREKAASWVIGADARFAQMSSAQSLKATMTPLDRPTSPAANWSGFTRYVAKSVGGPGGVLTHDKNMVIDNGNWPVHAPLTLGLPVVLASEGEAVSEKR